MWDDVISIPESESLVVAWRQQGITSAADLRARLVAEAQRRRAREEMRRRFGVMQGRRVA